MSFLNRLKDKWLGSDLNVTRPDFMRSSEVTMDFVVAKISLKNAVHTARYPIHDAPKNIDFTDTSNFKKQKDGDFAKEIYVRGWRLEGRGGRGLGGVDVAAVALSFVNKVAEDDKYNCFDPCFFELEVLRYINDVFGFQNKDSCLGKLGDGFYQYPVGRLELSYKTINDVRWCVFFAGEKGKPGNVGFAAPLSKSHILIFEFSISAYGGIDYFRPETNLKQASETIVKEFMENVHVELSQSSLQSKNQAATLAVNKN